MSVYETPKSEGVEQKKRVDLGCGVNCDWGFGAGIAIAMIGPLPGPTVMVRKRFSEKEKRFFRIIHSLKYD